MVMSKQTQPEVIQQELIDLIGAGLPLHSHLSSGALRVPFKHTPNICSISSNVVGQSLVENEAITLADPTYALIAADYWKAGCYMKISSELWEDGKLARDSQVAQLLNALNVVDDAEIAAVLSAGLGSVVSASTTADSLATNPKPIYRPRRPRQSPLFKTIECYLPEFERTYERRYAKQYGPWRRIIGDVTRRFIRCGDLHYGFARVRCPDCHHEMFVAFSCQQRCLCPSCHQNRTLLTAETIAQTICVPVPHRLCRHVSNRQASSSDRTVGSLLGRLPKGMCLTAQVLPRVMVYRNRRPQSAPVTVP